MVWAQEDTINTVKQYQGMYSAPSQTLTPYNRVFLDTTQVDAEDYQREGTVGDFVGWK